jgi:eukaryotic-like serine/threonine-protein kinase
METERWQRIESIFHAALEREPSRRAEFVLQACAGDDSLRQEVESLLAESGEEESFLDEPAMQVAAKAIASSSGAARSETTAAGSHPAFIGRYRVIRLLGEGGMGTVYEAEQEEPRRVVALKVIRPGLATAERLRRFRHESEALARLQHPGIAQIYDAGTADTGLGPQPYFAMELVRGDSLDRYAATHPLNTRERLALMARICEAVHHAHQRGLIHRDLKPGNILIDETGQPKILDFGVARLTEAEAQLTVQTELGQIVGTLAYMSPEQVTGDPQGVDTRSDVYSLGVILYELLTGRLPYDVSGRKLHEAVQTIREADPSPLSSISRNYRGDVETIVGKALEKDKTRRYASAAALAADIEHYLNDEPILARPPSASYQLMKFARRNRALVIGVAAAFVVLVAGIAVSTTMAIKARRAGESAIRERDRAVQAEERTRKERDRATAAEQAATHQRDLALGAQREAVRQQNRALEEKRRADNEAAAAKAESNFLENDLLAQAGTRFQVRTGAKPDPDLKVRTALDRAAAHIEGKFDKQPLVEASIRQSIGMAYLELGVYPEAQRHIERAIDLRRRMLGEENPDTLMSIRNLANLYERQGKFQQSESLYKQVLEAQQRVLGKDHHDTLETSYDLGSTYDEAGADDRAESLLTQVLETQRRVLGEENVETLKTASRLAGVYRARDQYSKAESLMVKTLETQRRSLGEDHPDTLLSMQTLALVYWNETKYALAEPLLIKALELQRRELGEEQRETLGGMNNLALLYDAEGKFSQAEPLFAHALEVERRILGEEHKDTLDTMQNLAVVYRQDGKYKDAEPIAKKTLEIRRRILGEENPATLDSMNNLACLYLFQGRYSEAEPLYARVLDTQRRILGEQNRDTLQSMSNLAEMYKLLGKYAEAERLATEALEAKRRLLGEDHLDTLTSMHSLGVLYDLEGRYEQAEPLLTKVLETRRRVLGNEHPDTLDIMDDLAGLRQSQGKYEEAAALLESVMDTRRRVLGPAHPDTLEAMSSLADVRLDQKKYADAEPLLREALSGYEKTAPDTWNQHWNQTLLGASLAGQSKFAEAEPLLVDGYEGMTRQEEASSITSQPELDKAVQRIVQLYESWGKPDKAATWKEKLSGK